MIGVRGFLCLGTIAALVSLARAETERDLFTRAVKRPGIEIVLDADRLQRDNAERREAFQKLEEAYPKSPNRMFNLLFYAQLLCDMRLHKESEAKYLQAAEEFKGTEQEPMCRFMAAQAIEYQGDYEKARKAFRDFMDRFRTHMSIGSAARHTVYMLCDEGKYDEARAFGEQALKDNPRNRTAFSLEGHLAAIPHLGKPLSDVTAPAIGGGTLSTKDAAGKVTLFIEWTPGEENVHAMGQVLEVRRTFDPSQLAIIGVVPDEKREPAAQFEEKHKLPWRSIAWSDVKDKFPSAVIRYPVFVLDREGKLRAVGLEDERLFLVVSRLVKENPPTPAAEAPKDSAKPK